MGLQKKSAGWWVLLALEKAADGYIRFEDVMFNTHYYYDGSGWEYPLNKSSLSIAIKRLREKGYIKEEKINSGEIILKLTDEGRTQILFSDVETDQWDGKWLVVIFDIPEQKRLIRDLFRRNLKKWGFKHFQKSVWISKKNITDKLFAYIKDLGVEKWVWVFESDKYGPSDKI